MRLSGAQPLSVQIQRKDFMSSYLALIALVLLTAGGAIIGAYLSHRAEQRALRERFDKRR